MGKVKMVYIQEEEMERLFDGKDKYILAEIILMNDFPEEDELAGFSEQERDFLSDDSPLQDRSDEINEDKPSLKSVVEGVLLRYNRLTDMASRRDILESLRSPSLRITDARAIDCFMKLLFAAGHLTEDAYRHFKAKLNSISSLEKNNKAEVFKNFLKEIPYGIMRNSCNNIQKVKSELDKRLYGMNKAKKEIIDRLVFRMHSGGRGKAEAMLFAGPPGTGKTSLAMAVSEALGLPLIRVSFSSMYDRSAFKGSCVHWSDGTPGLLIKQLAQAECVNPVILLDEIDKSGGSSAGRVVDLLSELLDPKQSCGFMDDFMEIPVDLSNATFICTANDSEMVPPHVMDRCSVINVEPYMVEERKNIIIKHMPEQVIRESGLVFTVEISDAAAEKLAKVESLRVAKRIIKSQIAHELEDKKPGTVKRVCIAEWDESLFCEEGRDKQQIGFLR